MAANKLSPKQEKFCLEYLKDLNGSQAAIRAGYSEKASRAIASELLTFPNVMARVKELRDRMHKKLELTNEWVLERLMRIADADMRKVARWNESGVRFKSSEELTDDEAYTIEEVSETTNEHGGSLKLKQSSKAKALELLGRSLAMFTDKMEHTVDEALASRLDSALKNAPKK